MRASTNQFGRITEGTGEPTTISHHGVLGCLGCTREQRRPDLHRPAGATEGRSAMTRMLHHTARMCIRHRLVVLGVWLVVAIVLVGVSHKLGDNTNDNLSLPGTGSQKATDTLAKSFPDQSNGTSPIVLHAKSGQL